MLGPLTYHAIAAMTCQRLRQIDAALLAKIRAGTNVSPLERQVRFLARRAHELMSQSPHLPNDRTLPPFARRLSQQTVFGSIGPSFPGYAALFAPSQSWLGDTIRRGNPDPNREMVLALSSDLMLEFWERSQALINSSDSTTKQAELNKARAYVLGHACHIAADLISAPFVQSVLARLGEPGRARLTPAKVADAIEFAVSKRLFNRDPPRGDAFKDWWPESGKLPLRFFDAYKGALEAKFGPGARPRQRAAPGAARTLNPQVSAAFWEQFDKDNPPDLSVRLLEDGYSSLRATLEHRYVWNWCDWLGATALIFLPPIFAYPLIVGMPHTRAMFKDGALVDGQPVDKDKAWFGLVMAPLVTSALAPPILSIYISALTYYGVTLKTVLGWVAGGVNLITAIIFLITLNSNVDPAVRWILLFILPFLGLLAHAIYVLSGGSSDRRNIQLALASLVPCIITGFYILFHLAWHTHQDLGMNGWLKETDGRREEWGNAGFIGGWVLWAGLLIGSWMIVARVLRGEEAAQPSDQQFVTERSHFLRLFDQSTLFFDPRLAQNPNAEERNPTLATHFFPTDRRPLLKVWWEGAGNLFMRSERNALRFSTVDGGSNADQFVLAPPAPMTLAEFARYLNSAVLEGANFSKKLKAEVVHAGDLDYVLPPGELFSDNGDDKTTIADHNTEAVKFTKLKTTRDEASLLYHAPRSRLANFVGKNATVIVDEDRGTDVRGDGEITVAAGRTNVVGSPLAGVNTRFTTFFKRGDLIQNSSVPAQTRIVDRVVDDQNLVVSMPFTTAAGPQTYTRMANNRDDDFAAGNITPGPAYRVVTGTNFDSTFLVGDIIRARPVMVGGVLPSPEERVVIQVILPTQLMTDKPFSGAVVAATPCERVGRATAAGVRYLRPSSIPAGIFSGDTLIDRAADMGALLAMGAVSHLLTDTERRSVTAGLAEDQRPAVNRVYQVFRNWNLNQRRMNEWRMLVFGNAVSEKRGAPRDPDPLQPGVPAGWTSLTAAGEETANRVGWVPLLQKWLDVAQRPAINSLANEAFREGDPTNRKLSEGIAFLFDLPMPSP